jgi:hypothetical protein
MEAEATPASLRRCGECDTFKSGLSTLMDHPCYKCAQLVEDGVPFCAHCSAPQIRVIMPDPPPLPVPSPDEPAALPGHSGFPAAASPLVYLPFKWSRTLQPCALSALISVILIGLGLNPFVAMLGSGLLAVVFYRRQSPENSIKAGMGARLGAITGLLCFAMAVILESSVVAVAHKGPEVRIAMLQMLDQAAAKANDPQVVAAYDYFKSPPGLAAMLVLALVFAFFAALILGTIGGALGGVFLGRRNRP